MSYQLKIYDNFHYMDDDEADIIGDYQTMDEAIKEAKNIVENQILEKFCSGTALEKLMDFWWDFGQDPVVSSSDSSIKGALFSGRKCAEEFINELKEQMSDSMNDFQSVYQKTISFASQKHSKNNQLIPGTSTPYSAHLSNVSMEILMAYQNTKNFNLSVAAQLALLHDTLEDTDTTERELEENFGGIIALFVRALTKNKDLPKEEQMLDSLKRIKKLPRVVWAVKLADRITNLQPPPSHWGVEKKLNYLNEARLIYEELKEGNEYLANRLIMCIENYKQYLN